MITGDYGPLGLAIQASTNVKTHLDALTEQAATGHVANDYAGLGAAAQTALDISPQIGQLKAQQSAINAVTGQLDVTQTALAQINSIATSLHAQCAELNSVAPTQIDSVAASARSALQQVAALLDTQQGGTYVFGGTDSTTPPVPDPQAILSAGFTTQIGSAVSGLGVNGAAATIAATLAIARSDAAGTTPFAGPPGQVPTVAAGTGGAVQVGLLASANTLATSTGSATTGSYMRDILGSLATLASLSSSQVNAAGFVALVQNTQASLSGAIATMGIETGALGDIQSSLTAAQAQAGDTITALTAQVSGVQDVDLAKTISDITQVQTQLSASYKLISEVDGMSLVQYL